MKRNTLKRDEKLNEGELFNRAILPETGAAFAEGNRVFLSVIRSDEEEKYLSVCYAHSPLKKVYKDKSFRIDRWNEFFEEEKFVCSVYDKETAEYVGYCLVHNLLANDWELAIELMLDKCNKGYGTEAICLFMKALHELTGKRFFRARVAVDNRVSQALVKKIGGRPNGISEYLLHGEELAKYQEENRENVSNEIREVAEEFCMNAEDILGCVLEYRFDLEEYTK